MVVVGPAVVAGLGLALAERLLGEAAPASLRVARLLQPPGALAAAASVVLDEGTGAAALACVWLAVCLCATAAGATVAVGSWRGLLGRPGLGALTVAAGLAYLSVGGVWLVISRMGWRPLGLSSDIVRLTSVHFHFAGFALPVLGAAALAAVDWLASRVSVVTGCLAAVFAPPVVALGFALDAAVPQVGGAVGMTVATWAVAFGTYLLATSTSALRPDPGRWPRELARATGRSLLVASSLSPIVPMVLAVQWALAQHVAMPALSVDDMASTHGLLNGLGFVVPGLIGWLLVEVPGGLPAPPGAEAETAGSA